MQQLICKLCQLILTECRNRYLLQALSPSIIDQYEAGIKNDFFNDALTANLTFYYIRNNNLPRLHNLIAVAKKTAIPI
jgi:outer membrane receptor for ferric coprogen and ferric-rhodotorulic acid